MPNPESPDLAYAEFGIYISSAIAILKYEAATPEQRAGILAASRQIVDGLGEFADSIAAAEVR